MGTQATVLVADDSRTEQVRLQWMLEQAGFLPIITADGREALEQIRVALPDVVVTDLNMPEMNGLELVEALQADFPKLPVVLATAVGSEDFATQALKKGAASYVPKRFISQDLVPTLRRLIAAAQAGPIDAALAASATFSEVRYSLSNDDDLVGALVAQLGWMIERSGIRDANGAMRVATAIDEALQNAMFHGNLEVSSKLREGDNGNAFLELVAARRQQTPYKYRRTHVRATVTADSAEFVICDEGPGFNPASIPDPTDPAYFDRPCGRGLWLIHAFMDEVRHNDRGNEIAMILRKQVAR